MHNDGVTRLLDLTQAGDDVAREQLFALVYDELRNMAHSQMQGERRAVTLNTTVLAHEAYDRLVRDGNLPFHSGRHFFAAAANAMRRIRVEAARSRKRLKRGGGAVTLGLNGSEAADDSVPAANGRDAADPGELIDVHEQLDALAAEYPRPAQVVELRYFAGLSVDETADILAVSPRTVDSEWRFARSWLARALSDGDAARD